MELIMARSIGDHLTRQLTKEDATYLMTSAAVNTNTKKTAASMLPIMIETVFSVENNRKRRTLNMKCAKLEQTLTKKIQNYNIFLS
jgi:hypothetical protein